MIDIDKNDFIVFDTETTGFEPQLGHKIIEVGAVRVVNGEVTNDIFHEYVDPQRDIPFEASEVHGMTRQDCVELGEGRTFANIADDLIAYFDGSIVVAHNAPFDTGFLDYELSALGKGDFSSRCTVIDSLGYANGISPTKKNNLDQLSKRYGISGFDRSLHGALLDSMILAKTFMAMRKSQNHLSINDVLKSTQVKVYNLSEAVRPIPKDLGLSLPSFELSDEDKESHSKYLSNIDEGLSW